MRYLLAPPLGYPTPQGTPGTPDLLRRGSGKGLLAPGMLLHIQDMKATVVALAEEAISWKVGIWRLSINGGTPIVGCFIMENKIKRFRGTRL